VTEYVSLICELKFLGKFSTKKQITGPHAFAFVVLAKDMLLLAVLVKGETMERTMM
jgi:hypothetical protein